MPWAAGGQLLDVQSSGLRNRPIDVQGPSLLCFFFYDSEAPVVGELLSLIVPVYQMADLELDQVSAAESEVDAGYEQQVVPVAARGHQILRDSVQVVGVLDRIG